MTTVFSTSGLKTPPLPWIPYLHFHVTCPQTLFNRFVMSSLVMITFSLPRTAVLILVFSGPAGLFFTGKSIPFGWKSSAYVYHSIGLFASHYFRSLLIPCSLYIDDRRTGEIQLPDDAPAYAHLPSNRDKAFARAFSAIFLVTMLFLLWAIFGYHEILSYPPTGCLLPWFSG